MSTTQSAKTQLKRLIGSAAASHVASARRWSPETKLGQANLRALWRASIAAGNPPPWAETGLRLFSQFEEDGHLLYVMTVIGERSRTFVDIGAADGIASNCANLAINHGWHGLFIDGDEDFVRAGREFYGTHPDTRHWPPVFLDSMVFRHNINELISDAGFAGEIDLLSLDIDGNDYWIWDALEVVRPRVVIIETRIEWGDRNLVMPYRQDHVHGGPEDQYYGLSLPAAVALASSRGYRLVGGNSYGFNAIFVADSEGADILPAVPAEDLLQHPRTRARAELFEKVRHRPLVVGGTGHPGTPARPEDL